MTLVLLNYPGYITLSQLTFNGAGQFSATISGLVVGQQYELTINPTNAAYVLGVYRGS